MLAAKPPVKPGRMFDKFSNKFVREYATASTILREDEKYLELTLKARNLFPETKNVDDAFVIEPVEENDKSGTIEKLLQVSVNFIDLGAHLDVVENA
jgi:hypothetical protein